MNERNRERIERLRDAAVEPFISYDEFYLHFYRRYAENAALGVKEKRYADAYRYAYEQASPSIFDGELIVGRGAKALSEEQREEWKTLRETVAREATHIGGQDSHMAVDYELLLKEGIAGVKNRISEKLCAETDGKKILFYETCLACLESVVLFANRYADEAERQAADCADAERAAELRLISKNLRNVPEKPAKTFYEAVQSVHFLTYCLSMDPMRFFAMEQFQLGHPDKYLYPYYLADKQAGILDDGMAQTLIDCLAIMINNRVPHGLSSGYMVGGRDKDGNIVANELTIMCMQAIDDIRLVYPSVGLCWTKGMDEKFLEKACEILSHGRSHPAIFNEDIISEGLRGYGVPENESHDYIHSTCVEITPVASSNVWVASPYTNMVQLLLDLMDREHESFEALMKALLDRLDESIRVNFERENEIRLLRKEKTIWPLLSCFVNDCIERGTDIEQGGAKYNWIMPSFVGMANLTDSLHVIRKLIFEKKEMTLKQLKELIDSNFEGNERLRMKLLNGVDKYGNDVDEVDELFNRIVAHIVEECRKHHPVFSEGRLIPSVFCWVMHERFGRETGASPDGRKAGFPLGDGSGPCQGREKMGPTASILSSTKWSHKELIGGVAVNMKFTKKTFTQDSAVKVRSLIRAYMERGGFEIQINVVDYDTLVKAQEKPEEYRDLVVRIGGYSDYFVKLSVQMQAEVLLRTSHEV